jgi:hypothetical protein
MQEVTSPSERFLGLLIKIVLVCFVGYFIWNEQYGVIFTSAFVAALMWVLNQQRTFYEISKSGIMYETGHSRKRYHWKDIESYSVGPDSWVEGMEEVTFAIKTSRLKNDDVSFSFDPQKLDKEILLQVLHQYAPGKAHKMSSRKKKEKRRLRNFMNTSTQLD